MDYFSSLNQSAQFQHEYNLDNFDHLNMNLPNMDDYKNNVRPTEAFEEFPMVQSRSHKTCANPFESSFQTNFQYEHAQAFENKLQNFMEAISQCSEKISRSNLEEKLISKKDSQFNNCYQTLDSDHCDIPSNEKNQFKVDLKFQKKLKEFLDEITKKCSVEFSAQLIAIANYIWVNYLKVAEMRFFQQQLKQWAQNLSQKFKQYRHLLKKTGQICFQDAQNEAFPNFQEVVKEFMRFYFVTVALVIEQYFENPYLQKEKKQFASYKRLSSEEDLYSSDQFSELQDSAFGGKRLKF